MTDHPEEQPNLSQSWLAWWLAMMQIPRQQYEQPILPNWNFGTIVNQQNSSAPETEQAIVSSESYGRQLGRVSEALAVLIAERPAGAAAAPALTAFHAMQDKIQAIKAKAARGRVDQFLAGLATLKRDAPADYRRVAARLRELS